jgi:hypothetical protein
VIDFIDLLNTWILLLNQPQSLLFCVLSSQNEVLQGFRQDTDHSFDKIEFFHRGLHIIQGFNRIVRLDGLNQRLTKQFQESFQEDKRVIKPKIADNVENGAIE